MQTRCQIHITDHLPQSNVRGVPEASLSGDKVFRDVKLTILLYVLSLGLEIALSGDKFVRDVKPTMLFLASEGHQRAVYLGIKLSGT